MKLGSTTINSDIYVKNISPKKDFFVHIDAQKEIYNYKNNTYYIYKSEINQITITNWT